MLQFTVRPGETRQVHVNVTLSSNAVVPAVFGGMSPSLGKAGEKVLVTDQAGAIAGAIRVQSIGGTDVITVTPQPAGGQLGVVYDKNAVFSLRCDYTDATGVKVSDVVATFNVDPSPMIAIGS